MSIFSGIFSIIKNMKDPHPGGQLITVWIRPDPEPRYKAKKRLDILTCVRPSQWWIPTRVSSPAFPPGRCLRPLHTCQTRVKKFSQPRTKYPPPDTHILLVHLFIVRTLDSTACRRYYKQIMQRHTVHIHCKSRPSQYELHIP